MDALRLRARLAQHGEERTGSLFVSWIRLACFDHDGIPSFDIPTPFPALFSTTDILIYTTFTMPMPGADKTTEAKEGILTYMRAWGGTTSIPFPLQLQHTNLCHRILSTSHRPRNPHHSPTLPPLPKATHALRPRPSLLLIPESERLPCGLGWCHFCLECCILGCRQEEKASLLQQVWRQRCYQRSYAGSLRCKHRQWWSCIHFWQARGQGRVIAC